MADAADSTPTPSGQFALTVADLNTAVNHEPRIEDLRLAEALGMERPRNIRKAIERHREALERLGAICSMVEQNTQTRGRGRPGRTFWLNKRQALYLCTKSETPSATETTIAMVEVFDAHLAGRLAKPVAVEGHRRALPRKPRRAVNMVAAPVPMIERDGFAALRVAGEAVIVDLGRYELRPDERAVRLHFDGHLSIGPVVPCGPNWYGARRAMEPLRPDPAVPGRMVQDAVQVLGAVVLSQPATVAGDAAHTSPQTAKRSKSPRALPAVSLRADLATVEICGSA